MLFALFVSSIILKPSLLLKKLDCRRHPLLPILPSPQLTARDDTRQDDDFLLQALPFALLIFPLQITRYFLLIAGTTRCTTIAPCRSPKPQPSFLLLSSIRQDGCGYISACKAMLWPFRHMLSYVMFDRVSRGLAHGMGLSGPLRDGAMDGRSTVSCEILRRRHVWPRNIRFLQGRRGDSDHGLSGGPR